MPQTFSFSKKISETFLFYLLWGLTFILLIGIALTSEGTYDTGDGVTHYIISRYSFKHPELFLDLWGKPLFTLLSSPFSQFGLKGITIFNITCGMLSSLCAFRIAKLLQLKFLWIIPILVIFSPIYFGVINSGLTEPCFSLLLIFAILKIVEKKYLSAAFVFSLAPFVRPEANFLIPVFAFYFIVSKNYKAIPMLFAGTILFSLFGWFYFGDILWLKTHSPYSAVNGEKYGDVHGELLNYITHYQEIIGVPLAVLFIAGCLFLIIVPFIRNGKNITSPFFREEMLLVYGCLFTCIIVHSVVWWKGIFPTLGLYRYMSSVMPLGALLCLRGLNFFTSFLKNIFLKYLVVLPMGVWICSIPFKEYYFPFALDNEERVVKQSADWLLRSPYIGQLLFPTHPYEILSLGIDPYDAAKFSNCSMIHSEHPGDGVPSKSIIIWDGHYGAHDNNLPVRSLLESADYKLLKKFIPDYPFNVFGDTPFEIYIFQRN